MKESKGLEYKEYVTNTFLKTVSAFSNYNGGEIIFGINDNGEAVGIENCEQTCLDIENKINDSVSPQPNYEITVNENSTISLTVYAGEKKPYMYKAKAYKRNDTATIEVDAMELRRLILYGVNCDYEELVANNQELTFEILEQKLMDVIGIDACDKNVLKTLNLYSDHNGYNIAAEILADTNTLPGIDIGKFGETISVIKKRKTAEHVSILSLYDSACEMYRDYFQYEVIEGAFRETKETIPEEAFREAVANALIHRLWDVRDHVRVLMFDDKIEIYSPGGLPEGMTKEEYIAGNYSKLRNPIISNVFYRLKIVEMFGTGIRRIKEAYKDSITKPTFEVYQNSIKIILPILKAQSELNDDEMAVYNTFVKGEELAIGEIIEGVPFGKTKTRKILNSLISQELIVVSGNGRGTRYRKQ